MNNKEKTAQAPSYHILLAIRRKKDNPELKEVVFRQIIRDLDVDLEILKTRIHGNSGFWRIYHTVNARLHRPAMKLLMKRLIDFPEDSYRIDTLFKTFLLKPECKATRHFLIDIDTKDSIIFNQVNTILESNDVKIFNYAQTPNGFHIVTDKFDTRLLSGFEDVSFQRDGYFLLDVVKEE